jgi:hypothetical protein
MALTAGAAVGPAARPMHGQKYLIALSPEEKVFEGCGPGDRRRPGPQSGGDASAPVAESRRHRWRLGREAGDGDAPSEPL